MLNGGVLAGGGTTVPSRAVEEWLLRSIWSSREGNTPQRRRRFADACKLPAASSVTLPLAAPSMTAATAASTTTTTDTTAPALQKTDAGNRACPARRQLQLHGRVAAGSMLAALCIRAAGDGDGNCVDNVDGAWKAGRAVCSNGGAHRRVVLRPSNSAGGH